MTGTVSSSPRRRGRGEARRAIIDAARILFSERGYDNTSLRDVAQLAQTDEALIFRSVGNKERLFRESVLEPFLEFAESFVSRWKSEPTPLSNEQMMGIFIGDLYDLLTGQRELMLALVSANAFSELRVHPPGGSILGEVLELLIAHTEPERELRGFGDIDLGMAVRSVIGLLLSMVLLDDWLLPSGENRLSRDHVVTELTRFVLSGLRPADAGPG